MKTDRVVKIIRNNEPPTKYDYKYFEVILESDKKKIFHYHINNPIPTDEQMLGLTWEEVRQLVLNMFNEAVNEVYRREK